jgi:hypothetical protein
VDAKTGSMAGFEHGCERIEIVGLAKQSGARWLDACRR